METGPGTKLQLTKPDRYLEILCGTILTALWVGTIAVFSKLPDQIPSHFNAAGQADDFGNRTGIFVLPITGTVIYIGLSILNKRPQVYNYLTKVTTENAVKLYTSATRLIRLLKLSVVVIFSGIDFMSILTAFSKGTGLGTWFLPVAIGLLVIPNIVYLLKSYNPKQTAG